MPIPRSLRRGSRLGLLLIAFLVSFGNNEALRAGDPPTSFGSDSASLSASELGSQPWMYRAGSLGAVSCLEQDNSLETDGCGNFSPAFSFGPTVPFIGTPSTGSSLCLAGTLVSWNVRIQV